MDRTLGLCLLASALISGCTADDGRNTSHSIPQGEAADSQTQIVVPGSPEPGGRAPDFVLKDLANQPLRLSNLRGTPVVLNFFASWCGPCLLELPHIREAHLRSRERGYIVLGVAVQDSREAVRSLARDQDLTFPMVIDGDNTVAAAYNVAGPPYTFFVDKDGIIVSVVAGAMERQTLERELQKLLNQKSS